MGLAALLKLTPLIFLPYFLIRDRKSFYWALLTGIIGTLVTGIKNNLDFLKTISHLASGATSGVYSNSFLGVIYNKYTYSLLSFNEAKYLFWAIIAIVLVFIFYSVYSNFKRGLWSRQIILSEFGALACLMIAIPPVSWLYNGVHLVIIFAAYWALRPTLLAKSKYLWVLLQDLLFFLVFSLPVLFYLPASLSKYFSLRALYIIILAVIILYLSQKNANSLESQAVSQT